MEPDSDVMVRILSSTYVVITLDPHLRSRDLVFQLSRDLFDRRFGRNCDSSLQQGRI